MSTHLFPAGEVPSSSFLHNKPNMALKSCCSISQPILQPFLFTRGNKKNHPISKFSKWGLLPPFLWKKIECLLPGRAQLGPVTSEWLGEHALCPLFSVREHFSPLGGKNKKKRWDKAIVTDQHFSIRSSHPFLKI